MRKGIFLLSAGLCMIFAGCSLSWVPPDEKITRLVENYYLYFHEGKQVKAKMVELGKFMEDCRCYPVKLEICMPERPTCNKTFYLFKNSYNETEVSEYKPRSAV